MPSNAVWGSVLCASLICAAPNVLAQSAGSPDVLLAQGKVFYQALEFEKCLRRLARASLNQPDPHQAADIELYRGLCQAGLGRSNEAQQSFKRAVALDPDIALPPGSSPKISKLFLAARPTDESAALAKTDVPQQIHPASLEDPRVEPRPLLVETETTHDWDPAEPPAHKPLQSTTVGPSNTKRVLPWVLDALAVGSAGTGVYFGVTARASSNAARAAVYDSDRATLDRRAHQQATAANISYGFAGASLVAGILTHLLLH